MTVIAFMDGLCCPMGCGPKLGLDREIHEMSWTHRIVCTNPECPEPKAVEKLLDEVSTCHVVHLDPEHWNCIHPIGERIGNKILSCNVAEGIEQMRYYGFTSGDWYLWYDPTDEWQWRPVSLDQLNAHRIPKEQA